MNVSYDVTPPRLRHEVLSATDGSCRTRGGRCRYCREIFVYKWCTSSGFKPCQGHNCTSDLMATMISCNALVRSPSTEPCTTESRSMVFVTRLLPYSYSFSNA